MGKFKERPPKAPRSKKAAEWKKYYGQRATWYADMAINLAAHYPRAASHAQSEAERFLEGFRLLRSGRHPNQISGAWK